MARPVARRQRPAPPLPPLLRSSEPASSRDCCRALPPPQSKSNRLRCFQSFDLTGLGRITPPLFQLQSLSTTGTAAYLNVEIRIGCGDQLWLGRKRDHHKTAFSPITALLPGLSNDHAAEKRSSPTRPTLPAHCTQPQLARLPSSRLTTTSHSVRSRTQAACFQARPRRHAGRVSGSLLSSPPRHRLKTHTPGRVTGTTNEHSKM